MIDEKGGLETRGVQPKEFQMSRIYTKSAQVSLQIGQTVIWVTVCVFRELPYPPVWKEGLMVSEIVMGIPTFCEGPQ